MSETIRYPGWAFEPNAKELGAKIYETYKKTDFSDIIELKKKSGYGHVVFGGKIKEGSKLTPFDILVYADNGNLCFGGVCTVTGDTFGGRYNTD